MFKLHELVTYTCIAHVHFIFNALCTWLPINASPPPPPPPKYCCRTPNDCIALSSVLSKGPSFSEYPLFTVTVHFATSASYIELTCIQLPSQISFFAADCFKRSTARGFSSPRTKAAYVATCCNTSCEC